MVFAIFGVGGKLLKSTSSPSVQHVFFIFRHRNEFKQRLTDNSYEKSLFHGCGDAVVDAIINENFNRSYAGVNSE
jgi:hypothetical protein